MMEGNSGSHFTKLTSLARLHSKTAVSSCLERSVLYYDRPSTLDASLTRDRFRPQRPN